MAPASQHTCYGTVHESPRLSHVDSENAWLHGLSGRRNEGSLLITAIVQGTHWEELGVFTETVTCLETLCKREGFGFRTNALCQHHIIRDLIGNVSSRRVCVGLRMVHYFKRQAAVLNGSKRIHNISSDIIESEFGTLKAKVSPNKLHRFTPMILRLPLSKNRCLFWR